MEQWERPVIRTLKMPEERLIVISDIHGDVACLKKLLDRLQPTERDKILFLGDLVEKGPESLATLRFVMDLCQRGQAVALCGNCDNIHRLVCDWPRDDTTLLRYALGWQQSSWRPGASLLSEMNRELGITLTEQTDVPAWKARLREQFAPEFDFLMSLPHVLETPDWHFVHGGLRPGPREEWTAFSLMKYDRFDTEGERQDRWCVVGHWPVTLYQPGHPDNAPRVNREKKIISIDGGRVLKEDGQLNAMVVQEGQVSFLYEDLLPVSVARDAQKASEESFYLRWGDDRADLVKEEEDLLLVRHRRTGREMRIPREIWLPEENRVGEDWTDYALPVAPGDPLKILHCTSRGYYCKKGTVIGWYYGRLQEK